MRGALQTAERNTPPLAGSGRSRVLSREGKRLYAFSPSRSWKRRDTYRATPELVYNCLQAEGAQPSRPASMLDGS